MNMLTTNFDQIILKVGNCFRGTRTSQHKHLNQHIMFYVYFDTRDVVIYMIMISYGSISICISKSFCHKMTSKPNIIAIFYDTDWLITKSEFNYFLFHYFYQSCKCPLLDVYNCLMNDVHIYLPSLYQYYSLQALQQHYFD